MSEYQLLSLGQICSLIKDGTHGTHPRQKDGIPLISAKDVHDGRITISSDTSRISREEYETIHRTYEIKEDDLLISLVGSIGRCALVTRDHGIFSAQRSVGILRSNRSRVDPKYLYHATCDNQFQQQLLSRSKSTAQAGVYLGELAQCSIPLPPLPEQKKIAEILSGIDKAIAIYEQQAKALTYMLDALMQEEIEMNTSAKWIKIRDTCAAQAGGTPDRSQKGYYEGDIPWVKSGEVKCDDIFHTDESISEEAMSNSSAKIVPSGSVLVAMYGATAGQTARLRIDATTNQAVLALNSNTSELTNDYLYHAVTAFKNKLLLTCQGSGQPNLSSGLIKEFEIPLPDSSLQYRISTALDSVKHRISALRSKINTTKSLKNSLSLDLFSGRKRVSV